MFRELRRKRQLLNKIECEDILQKRTSGVLAVSGDNDYPYAVPLNYVYCDGKIYFHSAKTGHKLDAMIRNAKVSFCVIDQDNIIPEEYTSYFRSVIVFGKMHIIEDEEEKRKAIEKLVIKYAPKDSDANRKRVIEKEEKALCMLELCIEHISGKESIELVKGEIQKS